MKLTTEDLGEIADVKADELARIVDQEVRDAFLHYLRANPAWRDRFQWTEIDV